MKSPLKIYFLIFIFLIFSTYNTKYKKKSASVFFPIKKILIENENNIVTNLSKLTSDLSFLINKSLFFFNEEIFSAIINENDFISNIKLKKKISKYFKNFNN